MERERARGGREGWRERERDLNLFIFDKVRFWTVYRHTIIEYTKKKIHLHKANKVAMYKKYQ